MKRLEAEIILSRRVGALAQAVGWDAEPSGANSAFTEPLSAAARRLGVTPTSLVDVTDSDLAALPPSQEMAFLALAEIEALRGLAAAAAALVDTQAGERRDALSQLGQALERLLAEREARLAEDYPEMSPKGLVRGSVGLGFMERVP